MESLEDLLTFLEKKIENVSAELSCAPPGTLMLITEGGRQHYVNRYEEEGVFHRRRLAPGDPLLRQLARKEFLRQELMLLKEDAAAVRACCRRYEEPSAASVLARLKKAYAKLPERYFFTPLGAEDKTAGSEAMRRFMQNKYEQSSYKPEKKIHITSRGLRVRSKSELLIAEAFYSHDVAFHYEEVLLLGERRFAPDFTIMRADGRLVYWEHCGLPDNEAYMAAHREKLKHYEAAGIVPWKNFIVTYDEADGTLNLRIIESEIENKIMI